MCWSMIRRRVFWLRSAISKHSADFSLASSAVKDFLLGIFDTERDSSKAVQGKEIPRHGARFLSRGGARRSEG